MAGVTFLASVGGDGSTVTDDANATTGLDGGGHRTRFVPALAQMVAVASNVVAMALAALGYANNAAASAASALGAPGTNATSATLLTVGTGILNFVIQTGKLYVPGQTVVLATTADPGTQMAGVVNSYNSGTGAITVNFSYSKGAGTFASWTLALAAISAVTGTPVTRQINGAGLATGGGDFSADRVITVTAAAGSDVRAGTSAGLAVTPKSLYDASASVNLAYGATITPNSALGINFDTLLTGNATLANLANAIPGESGRIRVTQDGTGSRTLAYGGNWKFAGGAPTLSTAANAVDIIAYFVHTASLIEATLVKDVK